MKDNPFSLDFGGEPYLMIPRYTEGNKILTTFRAELPSTHIFMIMGARGNGKTVFMSSVKDALLGSEEWIHVDLSPESDLMNVFAAGLYQKYKKKYSKRKMEISVDFKIASATLSAEADEKYTSVYTDLDRILEELKEKKTRVLITLDEAINSKAVREFTSYFQHCLREKYPVFLLMTGLYKNIRALQNNRSQTFLKRAPKVLLGPLNIGRIAQKYQEVFNLTDEEAKLMSDYTKGYSYAFQVLGYLVFDSSPKKLTEKILKEYKLMLGESSYDKIWEELSPNERAVANAIAGMSDNCQVKEVRERLQMSSNDFSTYQDTLEKSGILSPNSSYGRVSFALPFIAEYIRGIATI